MKTILQLCADTGSDTKPYQDDPNYNVILIGKAIGVENYHPPANVHGIIANPVCTEFSIANQWDKDEEKGMFLVNECLRIIAEAEPTFWAIENPARGSLRKYLGPPDASYQPWQYGSPWTKHTALWGRFNMPAASHNWEDVEQNPHLYTRPGRGKPNLAFMHKSAKQYIREFDAFDVDSDMEFRSLCSQNFAKAFKAANP